MKVIGIGRIGKDAVTRHTTSGKSVTGFSIAGETGYGEQKQTTWYDCAMWGERGEKIAEYIKKGDRIYVIGDHGTREHEGKTYHTIRVDDVTLLAPKREGAEPAKPSKPDTGKPTLDDDEIPFAPRGKRNHWE